MGSRFRDAHELCMLVKKKDRIARVFEDIHAEIGNAALAKRDHDDRFKL